jgi:hypothetical protein
MTSTDDDHVEGIGCVNHGCDYAGVMGPVNAYASKIRVST